MTFPNPTLATRLRAPLFTPARLAVSMMFLSNGFLVGSWAPKIPEFAVRLGLDESGLGLMILCFGIGSLVAMPLVGAAIARQGSQAVLRLFGLLALGSMGMITLAPNVVSAAVALFVFGGVIGGMDVAMNANAVEVEKRQGRAIMSSCHGFWSLGGVFGAGLGGLVIGSFGVQAHALAATLASTAIVALAWRNVMADPLTPTEAVPGEGSPGLASVFGASALVWLIGIMCLFSMTPEGAILDWGALYLRQELGAGAALSGLAFGAFSATMALMRFLGDMARDRFGAVTTLRVSCLFAIAGLALAGLAAGPVTAISGFAICGLGLANMVPICFSAAGNLPGLKQGVAISVVTFMGYSGILVAPSLIGFVAEVTGFAAVFLTLPLLVVVVLALSHLVRHADARGPAGR